jgi:hypothetical protein
LAEVAVAFEMVRACSVADVPAVAFVRCSDGHFRWRKFGSRLCGEEVHAVGNNVVERNLITILLDLLQDSSAQWFVGRRFQHGEKIEFVELFFSQLFEFEHLQSRFASIHQMHELFPFVLSETYAVVTVGKYVRFFNEKKAESCHFLFLTVVCNLCSETAPTEFDKSVGGKRGHYHHFLLLFAYFRDCSQ